MENHRKTLLHLLKERAYKHGQFTLSSGKESEHYINCKPVTLSCEGNALCSHLMIEYIELIIPELFLVCSQYRTCRRGPSILRSGKLRRADADAVQNLRTDGRYLDRLHPKACCRLQGNRRPDGPLPDAGQPGLCRQSP